MPEAKQKTVKLVIHANGDDDEQVMVSVNGKNWIIQREIEVDAPEEVVEALRLATRPVKRVAIDPVTKQETEHIDHVPRFPFSVHG